MIAISFALVAVPPSAHAEEIRCFCPQQYLGPVDEFDPDGDWWYWGLYHEFENTTEDCETHFEAALDYGPLVPVPCYCEDNDCSTCFPRLLGTPSLALDAPKRATDGLNLTSLPDATGEPVPQHEELESFYATITIADDDVRLFKLFLVRGLEHRRKFGWGFEIRRPADLSTVPGLVEVTKPAELVERRTVENETLHGVRHFTIGLTHFYVQIVEERPADSGRLTLDPDSPCPRVEQSSDQDELESEDPESTEEEAPAPEQEQEQPAEDRPVSTDGAQDADVQPPQGDCGAATDR